LLGKDAATFGRFVRMVVSLAILPDEVARLRLVSTARASERAMTNRVVTPDPRDTVCATRTTDAPETLQSFVARLPVLRTVSSTLVSAEVISAFRNVAVGASVQTVRAFLRGQPVTPPPGTASAPYFASPARTAL
jgi:hypothetical protein